MDIETRNRLVTTSGVVLDRAEKGPHVCACGCGEEVKFTRGAWSTFKPGHDARLVGKLLRLAKADEMSIYEAAELLEKEFSPHLSNRLMRFWFKAAAAPKVKS